jgi:sigma-B regulation protein RsbU (phosphoserine phosphatase)
MVRLRCAEILGGIESREAVVASAGMRAALYSQAVDGGRGGDVYYFSLCNADFLTRVLIADVAGHGEQVSAMSQYIYDALIDHIDDTEEGAMLAALNRRASTQGIRAMTTVGVTSYYVADGRLRHASAGHPPPLLRRAGTHDWTELTAGAGAVSESAPRDLPLAVLPEVAYSAACVPLAPGDRVMLYTDGLLDAPAPDGRRFGRAGVEAALAMEPDAGIDLQRDAVVAELRRHTGGALVHDDTTIILLEVI